MINDGRGSRIRSPQTRRELFALLRTAVDRIPAEFVGNQYRLADRIFTLIEQITLCADPETGFAESSVSLDRLAALCRWSERTVRRNAKLAAALGWLDWKREIRGGRADVNRWSIAWDRIADAATGSDAATRPPVVGDASPPKSSVQIRTICHDRTDNLSRAPGQFVRSNNKDLGPSLNPSYVPTGDGRTETNHSKENEPMGNRKPATAPTLFAEADAEEPQTRAPDHDTERREICEFLKRQGIKSPEPAVDAAIRAGCSLVFLWELIAYFRSRPGYWNAGQLRGRIAIAEPGQAIRDKWLPADQAAIRRDRTAVAKRRTLQAAAERSQERRESDAATLAAQEVERRYGPILDALTPDERAELESGLTNFEVGYWTGPRRRDRPDAFRRRLLQLVAERDNEQAVG